MMNRPAAHPNSPRARSSSWPRPIFFLAAADAAATLLLGLCILAEAWGIKPTGPGPSGPFGDIGAALAYAAGGLVCGLAILYTVMAVAVWRPQRAPTVVLAAFALLHGLPQALACSAPHILSNSMGKVFVAQSALLLATALVGAITAFFPDPPAPPVVQGGPAGQVPGGPARTAAAPPAPREAA
jgi:hypothetical protein